LRRLVPRGFAATAIARVTRAIGIAAIGRRAPGVVAPALAAQLVQASADKGAPAQHRVGTEA
jgi:xanthine/CO dehydrogenase XdhC/CoxF family maturation factor